MEHYLTPKIVYSATAAVLAFACLEIVFGIGLGSGFGETSAATFWTAFTLGATSWLCFRLATVRSQQPPRGRDGRRFFWRFLGFAFGYLTLDELFQIHEGLDRLIHFVLQLQETAWTDRIDDFILVSYALAGLVVLLKNRAELISARVSVGYLALAFALFLLSSIVDGLSNRSEYLDWLGLQGATRAVVQDWTAALEEGLKMFAGASIVLGFGTALHAARKPDTTHGP